MKKTSNVNQADKQRFELSLGQKALWFINSVSKASQSAYNESLVYSLKGQLSVDALRDAFKALIDKHEILRMSFGADEEGNLYQNINNSVVLDFILKDDINCSGISEYIENVISKPFDFKKAPLMRVALIKNSEAEHILVIVLHHIITDGTSFSILAKEISNFYNQIVKGQKIENPCKNNFYINHVIAESDTFKTQEYLDNLGKAAESLKGYSKLNFLTTPVENIDIYSGDRVYFNLDQDIYTRINDFSQKQRTTFFHFLFAVYCLFLSQYTRSLDVLVGVPFANRKHDLEHEVMGYFVNTLPIRIILNPKLNFSDLLSNIKSIIFPYLAKQDLAFEHMAPKLNLDRSALSRHPIMQTMFVWGSTDKLKMVFECIHSHLIQEYYSKTSKFDLSLFMLEENKEKITAYFEYQNALFDKSFVENMANSFNILIKNILNNPKAILPLFSMLDDDQKLKMKKEFFNSKLDVAVNVSLCELFSEVAKLYPQQIGLIFGNNKYDYTTLESRSNQWASYIRYKYELLYGTEMPPNALIALCLDRCEDMIFGMLGILKAGAAYVPIDPLYPSERINYIVNHSKASLLLTHKKHDNLNLDFESSHIIYMDDKRIQQSPYFVNAELKHKVEPQNFAYVLYTSGSTGKPKGVAITHENIICLFESLKKQFEISSSDIFSLFHTYCFDISVWEIWGAFLSGGTLLVVPYDVTRDPKQFYQLIVKERVSVLTQTPSAFQMFINEDISAEQKLENLRYVVFVGESLKVSILRPWVKKYGTEKPRLANMYGITETTVYTNYKFVEQKDIDRGRDNIGWPLEQFSMCVMDENLQWCPVGIVGEICIGGRGLAKGYLYRDDLTKEKFIQDPYASFLELQEDARLYRTGDLGRWMDDGSIEYLGRKDFQIKLRGFRVELGEIESALGSFEGVSQTAVLLKGEGESSYLAAYYTLRQGSSVDIPKLIKHLKSFLPEYMLPKTFTQLKSFPMTVNGKIDRKELYVYKEQENFKKSDNTLNSALDKDIAAIWADLLKVDVKYIGISSNFFELGGNSLLVVKMLALVSRKIGKELSLNEFITVPIIATLSAQLENDNHAKNGAYKLWLQLKNDVIFDASIQPLKNINPFIADPRSILLTGATGFLGAHILCELLEKTTANIYCLVRSSTLEDGLINLIEKQKKYNLSSYKHLDRIIPVIGDLSKERLGLTDHDFNILANNVDSILHVGAWVHHIYDYATLYKVNVESVHELLKLAISVKNKAIHFVSTLATLLISPLIQLPLLNQNSAEAQLNMNGYLTSKWVSEQLLKEASQRGIVAHVYRPGNIIAGKQGIYEAETNHTLLRLKGMLQLEKGYVHAAEHVEMMPVDLLANSIVEIFRKPERFSYNLHNQNSISWVDYLKIAKIMGYRFEFLQDAEKWNGLINHLNEDNALFKLSHFYKVQLVSEQEGAQENVAISPDYIITTPSYVEMIKQQIKSLIKSGFLAKPQLVMEEIMN